MSTITLPDGSRRHYDRPVTVMQVAADIGKGLAKASALGASWAHKPTRRISASISSSNSALRAWRSNSIISAPE